jgi:hypothetical protein
MNVLESDVNISETTQQRLLSERNIWVAVVRADGRPHLTPVWFVWHARKAYICIDPKSVKARSLVQNERVALALENGTNPIIVEGIAGQIARVEWPQEVIEEFKRKYAWDITDDGQYTRLIEIRPHKLLNW